MMPSRQSQHLKGALSHGTKCGTVAEVRTLLNQALWEAAHWIAAI